MVRRSIYRCRASNILIIRYEHNAGTEFEPLLETVVFLLQIADSQRYMPWCSYLFSLVFMSYFPIQRKNEHKKYSSRACVSSIYVKLTKGTSYINETLV